MRNHLSAIFANVDLHPVAPGYALLFGHDLDGLQQPVTKLRVVQVIKRFHVSFGYYQDMHRSFGVDIAEGGGRLILPHQLCISPASGNIAK